MQNFEPPHRAKISHCRSTSSQRLHPRHANHCCSHVIKMRPDVWAQGVSMGRTTCQKCSHVRAQSMPPAGQFPSIFDGRRAYVFGNRRKGGVGVVPQCELLCSSLHVLVFSKSHALSYPRSKRLRIRSGAGRRICSGSFTAAGLLCNSDDSTSNCNQFQHRHQM